MCAMLRTKPDEQCVISLKDKLIQKWGTIVFHNQVKNKWTYLGLIDMAHSSKFLPKKGVSTGHFFDLFTTGICHKGLLRFSGSIPLKDFYNEFFVEGYRVQRFHDLAKNKGIPSALVSQALKEKKAFWLIAILVRMNIYDHISRYIYMVESLAIPIYAYACLFSIWPQQPPVDFLRPLV